MNVCRLSAVLVALLFYSGCTSARQQSPYETLPGNWGWEGTDECATAPAVLRFSSHQERMHIAHTPVREDGTHEPRREANYTVTGRAGNVLSMTMDGEDRKTEQGRLVTWDLVVLDPDTYCWHRSDWRPTACTKTVRRCEAS